MKRIDWSDLEIVGAVARLGSIATAARELDMHYSTVTRRVDRFQREHDVRLFVRGSSGMEVADSARNVLDRIQRIATAIEDVERSLDAYRSASAGLITLSVPRGVLATELMPVLARLQAHEPGLQLNVLATDDLVEIGGADADIAVRVMRDPPPDHLVARSLGGVYMLPYATRDYLNRHDPFRCPEGAHWLTTQAPADEVPGAWHTEAPFDRIPIRSRYGDIPFLIEAARHGLGVAELPCIIADVWPDLVRLPGLVPRKGGDLWLLTHPDVARLASVRACMDTLAVWFRSQSGRLRGELDAGAARAEGG